jgi:ABC-2 type transport system ATP-binding protein
MDLAVRLQGITKRYGRVTALDGVDLTIPAGSVYGVVGPNGAGKTTLMRLLVGALAPDEGDIEVLGADLRRERRRVRSQIGYMPQAPVLYEDLTAAENVAFFARGHLLDDVGDAVRRSLEFTDLVDRADDLVCTLSGGMRQRVSLAATLVHQPRVLLLDEPTAGVDPELRHSFWERFRDLTTHGATLLISTHQMDEVVHCDRVAILRAGTVLTEETPQRILTEGRATVTIWTGETPHRHEVADYPGEVPRLLRRWQLDPAVTRIEIEGQTLEDAVLALIEDEGAGAHDG